jgi:hypothetical protein
MDPLDGLDRIDRWLNSGQGKQRAVLNWAMIFHPCLMIGMAGWFSWELFASASLITLPVIALAAAVLAVPLRRLAPALHARNSRRRPERTGPEFTWRWIAFDILIATELVLSAVMQSSGPSLSHGLQWALSLLQGVAALTALPLAFTTPPYTRRYAQARLRPPLAQWRSRALPATSTHHGRLPHDHVHFPGDINVNYM